MDRNKFVTGCLSLLLSAAFMGCVKSLPQNESQPFEVEPLDACLAIIVDMSGSFSDSWEDKAYSLFLELMDRFFTEAMGAETRVIIGQLSGNDDVLLFQGRPSELRQRFHSPEQFNTFLQEHSDPRVSPVFVSTGRVVDYVASMPEVTDQTRTMTVILSDMVDSQSDRAARSRTGFTMLDALKRYRAQGGTLALYYVAQDETSRWQRILEMAEFEPGSYVIQNSVVENPQLPDFD